MDFLGKLRKIIIKSNLIKLSADGYSFTINNIKDFQTDYYYRTYFPRQNKIDSFFRQLHYHGFKISTKGIKKTVTHDKHIMYGTLRLYRTAKEKKRKIVQTPSTNATIKIQKLESIIVAQSMIIDDVTSKLKKEKEKNLNIINKQLKAQLPDPSSISHFLTIDEQQLNSPFLFFQPEEIESEVSNNEEHDEVDKYFL